MKMMLKLFGGLSEYLPHGAYRNSVEVDLDREQSISEVIKQFKGPLKKCITC